MNEHGSTDVWAVDEREFPDDGSFGEQASFLLEYAILAPSSHNSQPWAFEIGDGEIRLFADESRWLEVADPDKRELHISLGCALENLLVAATRFGYEHRVDYHVGPPDESDPTSDEVDATADELVATVTLDDATGQPKRDSSLFDAISTRETNHERFEARPVPGAVLERLQACVTGAGVELLLVDDSDRKRAIAALQTRADERQFDDPAYRKELAYWIGTGALGDNWLSARVGQLAVRHLNLGEREGKKNAKLIRSAPVIGVLTATGDGPAAHLETGRAFERAALTATKEGLAVHPLSQILEVPEYRVELSELLDLTDVTPQHLFRLGYAEPDSGRTPRRQVEQVLR